MKILFGLGMLLGLSVVAQTPAWRTSLSSLPATPSPSTSAQDVAQFEKNMRLAAASIASGTSTADVSQANQALVQHMATYLSGLQTLKTDPQVGSSVAHAQKTFDSLGFARLLAYGLALQPVKALPPFDLNAPELSGVSDEDQGVANELRARYETDAGHSAGVWQNAETLRQSLELRGTGLNLETAKSMVRMPQRFRAAATALRNNDWDGARERLDQAEAETEKIAKAVGR